MATDLAALLQSFFTDRLVRQRQASPPTIAGYRDSFRLLLKFAQERLHKSPSQLRIEDLDANATVSPKIRSFPAPGAAA